MVVGISNETSVAGGDQGTIFNETQEEVLPPVCTQKTQQPPVAGHLDRGRLVLDAGCRYEVFSGKHLGSCLQGTWVVAAGHSNSNVFMAWLANELHPGAVNLTKKYRGQYVGSFLGKVVMVDIVMREGAILSSRFHLEDPSCSGFNDVWGGNQTRPKACVASFSDRIAEAPAYNPQDTRVTWIAAAFWDHLGPVVDAFWDDRRWAAARMVWTVQIGAWYPLCLQGRCQRQDLGHNDTESLATYGAQMHPVLERLNHHCAGERARGCFAMTQHWEAESYDEALRAALPNYTSLTLLDMERLTYSMPTESRLGGHGSAVFYAWVWQVALSRVCDPRDAVDPYPQFDGECYARQTGCPPLSFYSDRHLDWYDLAVCLNSKGCRLGSSPQSQKSLFFESEDIQEAATEGGLRKVPGVAAGLAAGLAVAALAGLVFFGVRRRRQA
eukprot:CAMPEP_0168674290 /NCGR_PEP_ID=MMETSP0503-20121227/23582_1 /TAXON_ID=89963 /ORGANISM="Heterocapsa rotundata, Strain SCCAP K-0483" /LENGTH=439 /DNA_ID=CAMNT_0008718659 /DNA_START=1 /DNA_END=1317 /DNA_ORIENTATION=+